MGRTARAGTQRSTGYLDRTPDPADRVRLFCFHHAGAAASTFAGWAEALQPRVAVYPVQLPGRENRVREAPITDFGRLLDAVVDAVEPSLERPYALYGHSMGAALAAAVARRQVERGRPPVALFVGGYPDPRCGPPLAVSALSDDEVADLLVRIGGMSEVVRRYPAWVRTAVRLLRGDLAALHSQPPTVPDPVPVPVRAYVGDSDPLVGRADAVGWAAYTSSSFRLRVLPGGHLFHLRSGDRLRADIAACLGELTSLPGGRPDGGASVDVEDRLAGHAAAEQRLDRVVDALPGVPPADR
ncbi:alpha/beta fold hydrolase [Micromonospora gifhornensis]|uniref:thioesterase II family protein n=1 Tax=Micromonospora gifhornensis TaxID=84594 RepID=UPI003453729E